MATSSNNSNNSGSGAALAASLQCDSAWKSLTRLPFHRTEFALTAVGLRNDQLAWVGGLSSASEGSYPVSNVEVYSLRNGTWRTYHMREPRWYCAVVSIGSDLYVLGGYNGKALDTAEHLYIPSQRPSATSTTAPLSRATTASCPLSDSASAKRVLFASVRLPPMRQARFGCAAAVYQNRYVIVLGGWSDGKALDTVEMLDTQNLTWSSLPPLPKPQERLSATCYADRYVIVVGGHFGKIPLREAKDVDDATVLASNPPSPHCASLMLDLEHLEAGWIKLQGLMRDTMLCGVVTLSDLASPFDTDCTSTSATPGNNHQSGKTDETPQPPAMEPLAAPLVVAGGVGRQSGQKSAAVRVFADPRTTKRQGGRDKQPPLSLPPMNTIQGACRLVWLPHARLLVASDSNILEGLYVHLSYDSSSPSTAPPQQPHEKNDVKSVPAQHSTGNPSSNLKDGDESNIQNTSSGAKPRGQLFWKGIMDAPWRTTPELAAVARTVSRPLELQALYSMAQTHVALDLLSKDQIRPWLALALKQTCLAKQNQSSIESVAFLRRAIVKAFRDGAVDTFEKAALEQAVALSAPRVSEIEVNEDYANLYSVMRAGHQDHDGFKVSFEDWYSQPAAWKSIVSESQSKAEESADEELVKALARIMCGAMLMMTSRILEEPEPHCLDKILDLSDLEHLREALEGYEVALKGHKGRKETTFPIWKRGKLLAEETKWDFEQFGTGVNHILCILIAHVKLFHEASAQIVRKKGSSSEATNVNPGEERNSRTETTTTGTQCEVKLTSKADTPCSPKELLLRRLEEVTVDGCSGPSYQPRFANAKDLDVALFAAVWHGHLEDVQEALKDDEEATELNLLDGLGRTAADFAAVMGQFEIMQLILTHGGRCKLHNKPTLRALARKRSQVRDLFLAKKTLPEK